MQSKYANLESNQHDPGERQEYVTSLFDDLAPRYDRFNRFVSFRRDEAWRRYALDCLQERAQGRILDLAAGTGDLALAALRNSAEQVHVFDISNNMLRIARTKVISPEDNPAQIGFQQGSAHALPFKNNCIDGVVSGFAMRNVFHFLDDVLSEIHRVLRPGGRFAILELSRPANTFLYNGFKLHMRYIMPLIGKLTAGKRSPFNYLCETTMTFLTPDAFRDRLQGAGLEQVKWQTFLLGGIAIHSGEKPSS
jgi:demethylmenaquinone methyltransferase/2-methoxy-6-polyprenyl-1,4-benzoquinol methylase